jgi:CBS domain-containing protein
MSSAVSKSWSTTAVSLSLVEEHLQRLGRHAGRRPSGLLDTSEETFHALGRHVPATHSSSDGAGSYRPYGTWMSRSMEVPQPNIPATPAAPDAPTTPAVPDPGTPGAPRSSRRCPSERSRRRRSTPILGRRPQRPRSGRGETDDSRGLTAGYAEAPMKTVADAMTTPPVVVATSTSVQEASSAMLQRRAQVAIVTRDERVWGLVTAPDVARALGVWSIPRRERRHARGRATSRHRGAAARA